MKKLKSNLAILFALQLLVIAVIYWSNGQQQELVSEAFVNLEKASIDKLIISSVEQNVELVKREDQWYIKTLSDLPANLGKVNTAIEQITSLKTNWPIATTTSSHQRFELLKDDFNRKIKVFAGEQFSSEILLGTSPSFKKTHIRKIDDDNVYSLSLNTYDFSEEPNDWLDKKLLATNNPTKIKGKDFTLVKVNEKWSLQDNNIIDSELDLEKAIKLSKAISELTVIDLVNEEKNLSFETASSLEVGGDKTNSYRFMEKDNKYYIKRDDYTQVFTLSKSNFDTLAGASIIELVVKKKETETTQQEDSEIDLEASQETPD